MDKEMDERIRKAYEDLVPKDQIIIASMIIALATKDKEIGGMAKQIDKLIMEHR